MRRRLVNSIKSGDDKHTGTPSSLWDISIEEAEGFDLHEELKAASGIGRRRKRGVCLFLVNVVSLAYLWFETVSMDLETSLFCLNK